MLLSEMANAQESHSSYHQSEPSIRIFTLLMKRYGLPWWLSDKNSPAVQKTQVQSLDQEDPLEKKMATHSTILAQEIPWSEEPSGLQSMGHKRIGHYLAIKRRRQWQLTPVFLPGKSHGRWSLVGCCIWGRTESDTTEATQQQQQQLLKQTKTEKT